MLLQLSTPKPVSLKKNQVNQESALPSHKKNTIISGAWDYSSSEPMILARF